MSQKQKSAKKPANPSATPPPENAAPTAATSAPVDRGTVPQRRCTIKEYVILNLIFDGFILVQAALVMQFMQETRGLYFFFGLLIVAFFLVSVFDYVYDRFFRDDLTDESTAEPAPTANSQ